MILSRRIALNGIQLDELHDAVVIRSVDPGVTQETADTSSRMGGAGQRITRKHWESLETRVTFAINLPKRRLEERRQIFEAVCDWARGGGWVTIGYMPGRRMYADRVVLPGSGDLWNWTAEFTIGFQALGIPFWQEEEPVAATADMTDGSMAVTVGGNVRTVMDVDLANISGVVIPNIAVTVNGRQITLTGVNLGGTETLKIHHGTDGLLRAEIGERSVYSLLTGADDLYADPGEATVAVKATRALRVTARAIGRYV